MIESSYHPGKSFVHTFDPRAKLLLLIAYTTAMFLPLQIEILASYAVVMILLALPSAGFRNAFSPLKMLIPVIFLIMILTPPFFKEGEVLVTYSNWILLTDLGLLRTCILLSRFIGITYVFFVFFRSTPLNQVILTLRWYGLSMKAALIISMTFRFIPYITSTYHRVSEAHKLRGSFQSGMWGWSRLQGLMPILTSVLIQTVKSIPVMSMSLEHRGFGRTIRRTSYQRLRGGRKLFTHLIFSGIIALILIVPIFLV